MMNIHEKRYAVAGWRLLPVAVLALMLGLPGPVGAQSANDLRRENERLAEELREAVRELDAARQRIAELEEQVRRLERALQQARRGAPPPRNEAEEDQVTIDESVPTASPRALYNALVASYEEASEGLEIGRPGDRTRNLYQRALRRWQQQVNRQHREPIEWHVHVAEAETVRTGYRMRVYAVDPQTHARLGESFDIHVPRNLAKRYEQAVERDEAAPVLVLRGVLNPQVRINEERLSPGIFDHPRLIGPFAEFRFTVDVRSLLRVGEAQE